MDKRKIAAVGAIAVSAVLGSPAVAQADPALKTATIDVHPTAGSSNTQLSEVISLSNVKRGTAIENKLPVIEGVEVSAITVSTNGGPVDVHRQQAPSIDTLTFSAPSSGTLRYQVRYEVAAPGGTNQLPIVIPAYAGADEKVVDFRYHVPKGYYLQGDSFPAATGTTGLLTKELTAVPSVIDYGIGTSPPSPLDVADIAGGAVIVLIIALSVWVFRREARASEEGVAHV